MFLNRLTIKEARGKLDSGEISSLELTKDCLARIKEIDGDIKACLSVCEDDALFEAKKADERLQKGERGDLLGIPYIAKDNILTKGVVTTASSRVLENYIAPFDATIVARLKKAGAVLLAKSNLDEFAHGASTENSAFGPTHNPWDLQRVPGGSSGGSGASVSADMCIFALGTDTGGSIRCPASFCGVTGHKPTYGRSSRFGLVSMTSSTDVPGPITKTAEDSAMVLRVIEGVDEKDATTIDSFEDKYLDINRNDLTGIKIGLPKEYWSEGIDAGVLEQLEKAKKVFSEKGAEFKEVSLAHAKYCVPVYYIITPSEVSSNLARFDGIRYGFSKKEVKSLADVYLKNRGESFGPEAKRRIMLGTYTLSAGYFDAYYLQAQKVRSIIKQEMDDVLSQVDCLLTPTSPHTAFKIGDQSSDPIKMYLEDIFVSGASLAGLPAVSIPCGFSDNLPVGMQLIGGKLKDNRILEIANIFQKNTDFHKQKPKI